MQRNFSKDFFFGLHLTEICNKAFAKTAFLFVPPSSPEILRKLQQNFGKYRFTLDATNTTLIDKVPLTCLGRQYCYNISSNIRYRCILLSRKKVTFFYSLVLLNVIVDKKFEVIFVI